MKRFNRGLGRRLGYGCVALAFAAACTALTVQADDDPGSDRRFYVAPMASFTLPDHVRGSEYGIGGELALGKRVTRGLELELLGVYNNYKVKKSDFPASAGAQPGNSQLYGGGAGFNIYLAPSVTWLSGLVLHGDVMRGQGSSSPGPVGDYGTTLFDVGLGYNLLLNKSPWGPLPQGMALRVETLFRIDAHNRGDLGNSYDKEHKYFQEPLINIGLRIPLGAAPAAATATPEETTPEVVPTEEPAAPAAAAPPCEPPEAGQPINLDGCKAGDTIVLRGVNFDSGKASLTADAKSLLNPVADALLARKDIKVEIDGHTDGQGATAFNQKLSEKRAAAVKAYLVSRGVEAARMTSKGYGKSMPVASNDTEDGRAQNRRVELKVIEATGAAGGQDVPVSSGASDSSAPASSDSGAAAPADGSAASPAADGSSSSSGETPAADSPGSAAAAPADSSSSESAPAGGSGDGTAPADSSPAPADGGAGSSSPAQ